MAFRKIIDRRGNEVFEVTQYWPQHEGRIRKYLPNRALARKLDDRITTAIVDGSWRELRDELRGKPRLASVTLAQFAQRFIEERCKPRMRSWREYDRELDYMTKHIGNLKLADLRRQHVYDFIAVRSKEVAPATVNRGVAALKSMLTWAVEMEILDVHPLFRFKMLKEQQKMFTPLTPEEVDLIIKAQPNHPMMALVAVMAETGLRRAEGISLMWSQVDLVNRRLVTGVTKNYRGRTIPLSTRALEWLMSMPRQDGIPEVFIRHKRCNGNKVAMVDPTATFFRAAKKVGLRGIGWHDLRRYRATQWHKMGLEVREIQYLLGHASIETTRRYLGIDRGLLERVQAAQNKELAQSERKDGIFGRTVDGQGQNREIGEAVSY